MLMKNCKLVILFSVALLLMTSCTPRFMQIRRAELLYKKGQVYLSEGEEAKAIIKFEESLLLAMKAGFNTGVAHNLNEIAIIHTSRGEYIKAREALARAIAIYGAANMKPEASK
ncbi:MAG: tetratricopeptide repeat protein, partial [Methanosarcinaceae archaeon]